MTNSPSDYDYNDIVMSYNPILAWLKSSSESMLMRRERDNLDAGQTHSEETDP
jgi:hypothetical protein